MVHKAFRTATLFLPAGLTTAGTRCVRVFMPLWDWPSADLVLLCVSCKMSLDVVIEWRVKIYVYEMYSILK